MAINGTFADVPFQSRNRDAFDFNSEMHSARASYLEFQSRNRDAFDFNSSHADL